LAIMAAWSSIVWWGPAFERGLPDGYGSLTGVHMRASQMHMHMQIR